MVVFGIFIPFLKISAHYSASDRAGLKRLEKNLKIKKEKSAKRKKSLKKKVQRKKSLKKKVQRKKSLKKKVQRKKSLKKKL
ncbi:hypothetical protein [Helicobacter pylori]|uniref:hypothetical protein n=1 Tax=Helicobacter pylori TaxID=210 RepID=UPI0036F2311C